MSEFLWNGKSYAEMSLERSVREESAANREAVERFRIEAVEQLETAAELHSDFYEEILSKSGALSEDLASALNQLELDQRIGFENIVEAVRDAATSLGSGLTEILWATERHASTTKQIYEILLASRANESRQVFRQGVQCYQVGDYEDARACFDESLAIDRTNHLACQYLGMVAIIEHKHQEALPWFQRAVRYATTDYHRALGCLHLARAFAELGDFSRARTEAESAHFHDPSQARFAYELSRCEARLANIPAASKALETAVRLDDSFWVSPLVDRAFAQMRRDVAEVLMLLKNERRDAVAAALSELRAAVKATTDAGRIQCTLRECVEMDRIGSGIIRDNFFELPALAHLATKVASRIRSVTAVTRGHSATM